MTAPKLTEALDVCVTFDDERARAEFEAEWICCTGGEPVDAIENGVQYLGDNAERAVDIANQVTGVRINAGRAALRGES